MSKELIQGSITEWKYISGNTLQAAEAFPDDLWGFSPGPNYGTFAKQVRHVIGGRGVFADGFTTRDVDFGKKHSFYQGPLSKDALMAALHQSRESMCVVLASMENQNLSEFKSNYYGETMTFIEHFSAMTCHEALHRGMWSFYSSLARKEI
jgi:hypothetical protein